MKIKYLYLVLTEGGDVEQYAKLPNDIDWEVTTVYFFNGFEFVDVDVPNHRTHLIAKPELEHQAT